MELIENEIIFYTELALLDDIDLSDRFMKYKLGNDKIVT